MNLFIKVVFLLTVIVEDMENDMEVSYVSVQILQDFWPPSKAQSISWLKQK